MRLTKRQLKRIIREEYSRLKRRGLIKEANRSFDDDPIENVELRLLRRELIGGFCFEEKSLKMAIC